ncbi:neutral zinc metallopeptidase [Altererythrobacter gangjinensis]|uniref:Neutral zinc metallopeptidase n=1 Tax=Pontixanthobacter gangjinensis TaxID=1028742 RepID=A0A6I4SN74_9SPHN|nr:neutral zinc metallopeptidase [Pontixanthobacter gangjinensis]
MPLSSPPYPTREMFEEEALAALASIPEFLRERLANVVLKVEEFATPEQLQSVNIATRWGLSGLYEGRPLSKESVWESGDLPPVISLFRQPLLREWIDTGVGLKELIRHVVIHEAGHHFGFSDDDMHQLERMAED